MLKRRLLTALGTGLAWGLLLWVASVPLTAAQPAAELVIQAQALRPLQALAFSPDEQLLAAAGQGDIIYLLDPANGRFLPALSRSINPQTGVLLPGLNRDERITDLAFSPSAEVLAAASTDRTVRLWDYRSANLLQTLSGHIGPVRSVAFHPKGQTLASAGDDHTVRLWEVSTGEIRQVLNDHRSPVQALAFDPEGETLAGGGGDGTVMLWDGDTGQFLRTLEGRAGAVTALAFPPFGRSLAVAGADSILRLWDRDSGALRWSVPVPSPITDLTFHINGQILASASRDGAVRLWDFRNGSLIRTLEGHQGEVLAVTLPQRDALASAGSDGSIRLWNPQTGELRLIAIPLPGAQWLSWDPATLYYNASPRGDSAAVLRFGGDQAAYPLDYYRVQLQQPALLNGLADPAQAPPPAQLAPKPLRLRWDRLPNKPLWFGLAPAVALLLMAGLFLRLRRADRLAPLRRFFKAAGFARVEGRSDYLLLSRGGDGAPRVDALALPWPASHATPLERIGELLQRRPQADYDRLYLICPEQDGPTVTEMQELRRRQGTEVIPLLDSSLRQALKADSQTFLEEQEAPYLQRSDPYDDPQPITDPQWFSGRRTLLQELPRQLTGGQHIGLFGLPQIGKSSVLNQVSLRLGEQPVVLIRSQGLSACADPYFLEILNQFRDHLSARGCKRLPKTPLETDVESFRRLFMSLYRRWRKSRGKGPVVIVIDGLDRLLPNSKLPGYESVLAEYSQLFRPLRDLAADEQRLVLLISALRPEANRRRELGSLTGDNPLEGSLHEVHLAPLEAGESAALLRELGAWKAIDWDNPAVERVFHHCGGHPLLTRLLASAACRRGTVTRVEASLVDTAAAGLIRDFEQNVLGDYFRLGLWKSLDNGERQVLEQLRRSPGLSRAALDEHRQGDLDQLLRFGLVTESGGRLIPRAALFWAWLDRHLTMQRAV